MVGLFLILFALVALWAMYKVIVYALPCLIGYGAALLAFNSNAGYLGASIVGLATAVSSFFLIRFVVTRIPSRLARWTIAAAFAIPSAYLAYNISAEMLATDVPSYAWRLTISVAFGLAAAWIAFSRLTDFETLDG